MRCGLVHAMRSNGLHYKSNYINHPLTIKVKSKFKTFHCGYHLRSKARSQLLLKPNRRNGDCKMVKRTKPSTPCNFDSSFEHI